MFYKRFASFRFIFILFLFLARRIFLFTDSFEWKLSKSSNCCFVRWKLIFIRLSPLMFVLLCHAKWLKIAPKALVMINSNQIDLYHFLRPLVDKITGNSADLKFSLKKSHENVTLFFQREIKNILWLNSSKNLQINGVISFSFVGNHILPIKLRRIKKFRNRSTIERKTDGI